MQVSDALIIAALIAVARWVFRSVREGSIELPDTNGGTKPRMPQPPKTGQKRAANARLPAAAPHGTAYIREWNVVLDVPIDAPRSEIQAAAKRRIAQAISSGDRTAVEHVTRAAAIGLKQRALRTAGEIQRGKRGP